MKMWVDDVSQLYENPLDFVPSSSRPFDSNVNALTRLIVIFFVCLSIIRRSLAYVLPAILCISVVAILAIRMKIRHCPEKHAPKYESCLKPTRSNPFMNNLDVSNDVPCKGMEKKSIEVYKKQFVIEDLDDGNSKLAERNFYTLPGGGIPNFGEFSRGLDLNSC